MLSTYKGEWNRELNTAIQTVHQRVLGCKLGISSNWVFQHALVKICHLGGVLVWEGVSPLFQAVFCEAL